MASSEENDETQGDGAAGAQGRPDPTPEGDKPEETSALKLLEETRKATEALKAEKEKLLEDVKGLRGERRALKTEAKVETTVTPADEDDLSTPEGWDKRIDKRSKDAVAPVLSELEAFKDLQRKKAVKAFESLHPEYSAAQDPDDAKMNSLLDIAKRLHGEKAPLDSDSYLEALNDAWAVKHRSEIQNMDAANRKARAQGEDDSADVATGSSPSERKEDVPSATPSDYRSAKIAGMPIEKYLKLKKQLDESAV